MMVQTVGAGWLMATIASSSEMVALVQSATTLPVMLFSVLAGVFADNYSRRNVLLTAQILMMAVSAALMVLVTTGLVTPMTLLLLTFLLGCGTALHTPAWQASVGDVVPRDEIASAVTLNGMSVNLTRSLGPAFGGFIVAAAGAGAAFALNAISFIPMILVLLRWRVGSEASTLPRERFHHAVGSGLRYVAMSPNLMRVMLRGFIFGVAAIAPMALLPVITRDLVEGGASTYGLLLGAYGVGALGGGVANATARSRLGTEAIIRLSFAGFALCCTLIAYSQNAWLTAVLLLPAGACWVLALSLFNVVVQLATPRWVVGRTLSIYQTASFGGMTAGAWLWGAVAERAGTPEALWASAGAAVLGILFGLVLRMPDLVAHDLTPLNRFREPALAADITARSGPVRIHIEYEIPVENTEAFLRVIRDRRRIRLRDGARHWVLLRDLETPELWKETYQYPTWSEYVRCSLRTTQADADISGRLRVLSRDEQLPTIRRMIERHSVPSLEDMAIKAHPEIV
jgi:MFS family permease